MKKGFTLVELIGVLVVLGLIGLITIPTVNNSLKKYKAELFVDAVENVKQAAKNWGADNIGKLPNFVGGETVLTYPDVDTEQDFTKLRIQIRELQSEGYIDSEIKNPKKNANFCNCAYIVITKTAAGYTYNIEDQTVLENASCCGV